MKTAIALPILAMLVAGCGRAASSDDPAPEPPQQPRFDRPAMVRYHMRRHFSDLRTIERLLVAGKLEEGRTLAGLLARPETDPGMAPWAAHSARVVDAATALTASPGLDEACRREARVAQACAECHVRTQRIPVFHPPAAPADDATPAARMARHQWAADRLWEGMVAGSEAPWRDGLGVLATTPLPFSSLTDAPALASRLQSLAQQALAARATDLLPDRARAYGEMLVTCAACHATLAPRPASASR